MVKPQKVRSQLPNAHGRPGEGALINIAMKTAIDSRGVNMQVFQAELESAPVPERKYSAGVADAIIRRGDVELMFGQEKVQSQDLRSLVVIVVGAAALQRFLESCRKMASGESIFDIAQRAEIVAERLVEIESEPTQTVAFRANQIAMAFATDETCMDFFQASAFSVSAANATRKLAIDPLVRVEIRTSLLLGLLEKLESLASQLPPLPQFKLLD